MLFDTSEGHSLISVFLILIPSALYIMGLMEGKKGYYLFLLGLSFHLTGIILRGVILGTIPLTEKHDNISFTALSMALVYLYFYRKKLIPGLGITALPMISLYMLISLFYTPINTISPFQKSLWFYLHMFLYFLSYGFFGISSCIGLHYLWSGKSEYEQVQYKGAIHGWVVLSASLVAGSVWFFVAYGTYWLWTSKELWITILWFYYGLYLHTRFIKGLTGRPASIMGCAGFLLSVFTYFGVGTIIPSPTTQF